MSVGVKICGLKDARSVVAAIEGGAHYVGFVFYPQSPRAINASAVRALLQYVPQTVVSVGLFVDPTDAILVKTLRSVSLGMIQLHGQETLERVGEVKGLTQLPVLKAVGIANAADLEKAHRYATAADMLLLDAIPPEGGSPGGNAVSFDWTLLAQTHLPKPWMLAGGLKAENLTKAVRQSHARCVDVSSGVEDRPGHKNPAKIKAFLEKAHQIETCY